MAKELDTPLPDCVWCDKVADPQTCGRIYCPFKGMSEEDVRNDYAEFRKPKRK